MQLPPRDTKASEKTAAKDEKELRDTLATALSKAEVRLKVNRNDTKALYAKGVAKGTLAAFEAVAKGN